MTSARCRSCWGIRSDNDADLHARDVQTWSWRTQPARRLDAPAFASLQRGKEAEDWGEESAGCGWLRVES